MFQMLTFTEAEGQPLGGKGAERWLYPGWAKYLVNSTNWQQWNQIMDYTLRVMVGIVVPQHS